MSATAPHLAQELAAAGQTAEARELCAKLTVSARRRLLGTS